MNIQNYLINPMGKGSSVMMLSNARKELDKQYIELYTKMSVKWYILDDKYYIAHVKVPSKSREKLWYDVLLEFDIDTMRDTSSSTINNANVRVFSNCPSFAYTYANVFNQNKDLIDWTRNKYPRDIITKKPEVRNPYGITSYERSLYFAIKYVLSNGRNYKAKIDNNVFRKQNYLQIYNQIKSLDEILDLYHRRNKLNVKERKDIVKTLPKKEDQKSRPKNATTSVAKTRVTKTTSKVKKSKKTNKI